MTFYEQLKFARENEIDAIDIYCGSEAEWFVRDYCGVKESDPSYVNDFNNIAASIKEAYIDFEHITFEEIEDNLMYLRDIYKNLSVEEIGDNLIDCINNELSPDLGKDNEETMER